MPKREEWLKRSDRGMFARPDVLYPGPNARSVFDDESMGVLREQIRQMGVLQPLVVRRRPDGNGGELQVWDGERRLRAVQSLAEAGTQIEWVPVVIRRASEAELLLEAATTQTGREPLDVVDEASLVRMLEAYGLDADEIAERLAMSITWVRHRAKLAGLAVETREALRRNEITLGRALELAEQDTEDQQEALQEVRERAERGEKKAGSATVKRPGKRILRRVADELENQDDDRRYGRGAVVTVMGWAAGDVEEGELRQALGLPAEAEEQEDPRQVTLEDDQARRLSGCQDALGVEPPARPEKPR